MSVLHAWEITYGFEPFPPNTREFLFIDLVVPDDIVKYTLQYANNSRDFEAIGITMADLDGDYTEGDYVFAVHFEMNSNYTEAPCKTVRISAPAYIDITNGNPFVILAIADKKKRKGVKRSNSPIKIEQ